MADYSMYESVINKTVKERIAEQKDRAKKRRIRCIIFLLSLAALVTLIVVVLHSPLFAIEDIQIINEGGIVSATAVEEASGILPGDLIWRVDTEKAQQEIYRMPWITSVTVKRKIPNRIVISIVEGEIAAYIESAGQLMAIDSSAKTIAVYDWETRINGCPVFTGIDEILPQPGELLAASEEQLALIRSFIANKEALIKVNTINIQNPKQVDLDLYSQMTVKLGGCDNLKYKLSSMEEILKQLGDTTGVLDMRVNDGKASYRPTEKEEATTEPEISEVQETDAPA